MDIKGENFHVTHKQRLADGGEVYVLDPVAGIKAFLDGALAVEFALWFTPK
jgi:hypothetical protein